MVAFFSSIISVFIYYYLQLFNINKFVRKRVGLPSYRSQYIEKQAMPGDDHHANMTPQKEAVKTNQSKEIAKDNNGTIKVNVKLQFVETSVGRSHVPRGYVLAWWYQWRIVNHVEVGTPLTVIILASFKY